jgi:hypothetical protein
LKKSLYLKNNYSGGIYHLSYVYLKRIKFAEAHSVMRENCKIYASVAYKGSLFILIMLFSAVSFNSHANETELLKVASSLEQRILIKNDVIETLNIGVSQLEKACGLEKNKEQNSLIDKNLFTEQLIIKKRRFDEFTQNLNVSINTARNNALKIVRNRCSILGQLLGTDPSDKQLCENTKNKIEFIDRLNPIIANNVSLENLEFNTLSTLVEIEYAGCTTNSFLEKIFGEIKTVLEPLNTSIENELKESLILIE